MQSPGISRPPFGTESRESDRPRDRTVPVSVIVPVKNEAENLRRCLPALSWADEVFVVDSRSTDETSQVAEQHGAKLVQFLFNGTFPKKKNWALENLPFRNEWVLIVDADEVVLPELAAEIARRIQDEGADGYYLNSRYYFLGRRIRHCGYSECWNLRLFKHRLGRYERMPDATGGRSGDNEAHEHVELDGQSPTASRTSWNITPIRRSPPGSRSTTATPSGRPRSTSGSGTSRSRRRSGRGKRFKRRLKKIALRLPFRPFVRFVYAYVLRLGFLDGRPGLIFCGLLAFYDFLASANRYEQQLRRDSAQCEDSRERGEPGDEGGPSARRLAPLNLPPMPRSVRHVGRCRAVRLRRAAVGGVGARGALGRGAVVAVGLRRVRRPGRGRRPGGRPGI